MNRNSEPKSRVLPCTGELGPSEIPGRDSPGALHVLIGMDDLASGPTSGGGQGAHYFGLHAGVVPGAEGEYP